ncbi:MAG: hypothetical protein IJB74_01320 [Clostridia bacterium]|nr:hypothetical protein [Clostridia bacterium]
MPENKEVLVSCYREKRHSEKKGTDYEVLVLIFENGYKMDVFLNNEQQFIIGSVVPLIN